MKKRAFLLPLAVSLAGLIATSAEATPAAPAATPTVQASVQSTPAPAPLVLKRSNDSVKFARHGSHSSHASHASHSSHYSSR